MWKSLKVGAALSGLLFLGLTGCGQQPPAAGAPKAPSLASQQWDKLTAGFIQSYFDAQPFFAAQSGRHEFDGQLPDLSNHGLRREIARLHDERDQISAVDPQTLEPRERFDREYLLAVVDRDLFWTEKAKFPFTNPNWYIDKLDPDMYLNRNYAPLDVRMKAYIKYARGIPKVVKDILQVIAQLRQRGMGLLLIEQNVGIAAEITERAYVMSLGRVVHEIGKGEWQSFLKDDRIVKAYLG